MHIPDGFIDARTAVTTGVLAAAGLGLAIREVRRSLPPRRVPLIGLAAAFIFAAQMVNFPVAGGTSGHLIGGVLAAVLLGPAAAVVVMSAVLILQCFMFADGGVTALGANLLNMGVIAPSVGFGVFLVVRRLAGEGLRGTLFATAFGAWCSTVVASIACAGQLAMSGTAPWQAALPAMGAIHMVIGLGEAAITALVVAGLARARPELLAGHGSPDVRNVSQLVVPGLLVAFSLALFVAPFASPWPDGLERVAASLGFEHAATPPMIEAPLPDYAIPGIGSAWTSTVAAGCIGTAVAFLLAYLLARAMTPACASEGGRPCGSHPA
jgi:cobalt/nickel transport system permease protein